jgi:nitrogenase molybdenum-iron protein alpha chain
MINVITFRSNLGGLTAIRDLLGQFDLFPQFVLSDRTIEELSHVSEAAATLSVCGTLGGYFGNGLEQHFGVPFVKALQPHGISGMNSWLGGLAKIVGKEKEVAAYLEGEKNRVRPELEEIRRRLKGKRAVIGMGPSFAHSYARVLDELGVEVIWTASWHFDQHYDHGSVPEAALELADRDQDFQVSVADQQNFEMINLLTKLKPDFYLSRHPGLCVWSMKLGIPSLMVADVFTALGYAGVIDFGYRIVDALANNSLARNLSQRVKLPYTDWWFEQDSFSCLEPLEAIREVAI